MNLIQWCRPGQVGSCITVALLVIANCCVSAGEQEFGRLFTTREQRQWLQALREEHKLTRRSRNETATGTHGRVNQRHTGPTRAGIPQGTEGSRGEAPAITLKGLIYKKDKAQMAWFEAQQGSAALDYRELPSGEILDNAVTIELPATGKTVKLKPGQSYHPHSGAVTDLQGTAQ